MALRVGVFLPHLGVADRKLLVRFARSAEALGFDSVWAGDHIVLPRISRGRYPYTEDGRYGLGPASPLLELWTTLSFVAGCTERVRLGSAVCILPYRHPALTAKMVATLDHLSGGRVEFGVGTGWLPEELETFGSTVGERGSRTDEQLTLIRALWTEDVVDFEGRYYSVRGLGFAPKPVQRPHPPIWVGGNAPAARRRAARDGSYWMPAFFKQTLADVARWRQELTEDCVAAGRPADAVRMAGRVDVDVRDAPDLGRARNRDTLVGAPELLAESVRALIGAGVDYPIFMLPPAEPDHVITALEKVGTRVLPLLSSD